MKSAADRVESMLAKLEIAWTEFRHSFAGLANDQLAIPGVVEDWSINDLIAHIAWWEEEALKHLPLVLQGGTPPKYSVTYGGLDAFNAQMTKKTRSQSEANVVGNLVETHHRLVAYIRSVPPEAITSEPKFRHRLRLDTFGHYPIHTKQILEWRERQSKG